MSTTSLPLININPFLPSTPYNAEARRACARSIHTACTTTGFFYLTGHGIPKEITDAVLEMGRDFFLNSPEEDKAAMVRKMVGVGEGDGTRGWQPLRDNVTGGKRDWQEAVDFYKEDVEKSRKGPPYEVLMGKNLWPKHPEELKEIYEDYVRRVLELGEAMMTAMGAALGEGNEDIFLRQTRDSFWGMRLIGYAPIPDADRGENYDDGISCGAHTDYGCVTFLLTDGTKGALQVKSINQTWINADPIPGAFVVNIGDMMERWTNGLWRSTTHRVVHRGDGFRVSVPFFYEPDFNAIIKPLQTCIDRTGGIAKYKETVYGQHLLSKVSKNFYTGVGSAPPAKSAPVSRQYPFIPNSISALPFAVQSCLKAIRRWTFYTDS